MDKAKIKTSVGGHEMTDEQKLRVLNTVMKLQESIFAIDSVENIPWFYCLKTKQTLKAAVTHILKEHSPIINALWAEGGAKMDQATNAMEEYSQEIAEVPYWEKPNITHLIRLYKSGELNHLFPNQEGGENGE